MDTMFEDIKVLNGEAKEQFYRLAIPLNRVVEQEAVVENLNATDQYIIEEDADSAVSVTLEELETESEESTDIDNVEKVKKRKETVNSLVAAFGVVVVIVILAIILIPKFRGDQNDVLNSVKGGGKASFVVGIGDYMPDFLGFIVDPKGLGSSISKPDLVGKSVVLFAWRSQDPESKEYLRALTQMHSRRLNDDGDGVEFIGLCLDEKIEDSRKTIFDTNSYKWDHIYDWDKRNDISQRPSVVMKIIETPSIYIFDSLSRLRKKGISISELSLVLDGL